MSTMDPQKLSRIARALVAPGKGILAMDESAGTIRKRFDEVGVKDSEETRRAYREMLITTPGLGRYISGAILFDETIRQKTTAGIPFPAVLKKQGILQGIKVDNGTREFAPGELLTEGLDGLRGRLAEYKKLGAQFAKWRAVIAIGSGIPTQACIDANANALARYAVLCHEQDIVPIVEPEVLMDGTHTIQRSFEVTAAVQKAVFAELKKAGVLLEGTILKPNMVLSGYGCPEQADPDTVAEMTIRCLKTTVPKEVPGIAFLSGGQSDRDATIRLNAMNTASSTGRLPWRLTFSYGRGLQREALKVWNGKAANVAAAQTVLLRRAKENAEASEGVFH